MNVHMDVISEKTSYAEDDTLREGSPMPLTVTDPDAAKSKEIVTDFVHLLEKSKNLFNGLKWVTVNVFPWTEDFSLKSDYAYQDECQVISKALYCISKETII